MSSYKGLGNGKWITDTQVKKKTTHNFFKYNIHTYNVSHSPNPESNPQTIVFTFKAHKTLCTQ